MSKFTVYLNKANENWVADRFRDEWYQNSKFKTKFLRNSDIVWIISPWTWQKLDTSLLKTKKVVCTIHHLDIDKFNDKELKQFLEDYLIYSINRSKIIISTPTYNKSFYYDFDHVKPYHPNGILMVFSKNIEQVQFNSNIQLCLDEFLKISLLL